jgi:NADPH:quinone reductase-like Zn-dependent oxidoreductase
MMSTMQAITVVKDNSGSYSTELSTVPMPELTSPHGILVRVHACAINPVRSHTGAHASTVVILTWPVTFDMPYV